MTARLQMLCHAATTATHAGVFATEDPIEERERPRIAALRAGLATPSVVRVAPARAARETAEALGFPAIPDAGLADLDAGRWRGRALADVAGQKPDALAAWMSDPHAAPHGGETVASLVERVGAWLDAGPFAGRILAVTHAAVVRAAIVHVLGAPLEAFWAIDAGPLAVASFSHDGRRWALRCPTP